MMDDRVLARCIEAAERAAEIERELSEPATVRDQSKLKALGQELSEVREITHAYDEWKSASEDAQSAKELLREASPDEELALKEELSSAESRMAVAEAQMRDAMSPKDPRDTKDVIVEIRAAAGGDEAALFAGDLFAMYQHFAEKHRMKTAILNASEGAMGGYKDITFEVRGKGTFARLRYESGVHRVQRVPTTESQGRIHTSTATVAVLPEADEVDVQIDPRDLEIDVFRSSGPGGQSVNTTDSAVRITHVPTGEVVACQEERSQLQNKERAMRILRARLYERAIQEQQQAMAAERKGQVGTGERSEKIRTYNFKENRVTDHRVKLTLHRLNEVLAGDLDELIAAMRTQETSI